eukprot:2810084-Pleurochrysis_carterae.AAC.1
MASRVGSVCTALSAIARADDLAGHLRCILTRLRRRRAHVRRRDRGGGSDGSGRGGKRGRVRGRVGLDGDGHDSAVRVHGAEGSVVCRSAISGTRSGTRS